MAVTNQQQKDLLARPSDRAAREPDQKDTWRVKGHVTRSSAENYSSGLTEPVEHTEGVKERPSIKTNVSYVTSSSLSLLHYSI